VTALPITAVGVSTWAPKSGSFFSRRTLPEFFRARVETIADATLRAGLAVSTSITKVQHYSTSAHWLGVAMVRTPAPYLLGGAVEGWLAIGPKGRALDSVRIFFEEVLLGGSALGDDTGVSVLDEPIGPDVQLWGQFLEFEERVRLGWYEDRSSPDGEMQGVGARQETVMMVCGQPQSQEEVEVRKKLRWMI